MKQQHTNSDFDRFMRIPEVAHVTGLSRSTIYDSVNKGIFPKPVRLTVRAIAWKASDIKGWMEARQHEAA